MADLENDIFINSSSSDTVPCLSCFQENDKHAVFCKNCNSSLSLAANFDPLKALHNEGMVYSKAVVGKPKLVVLIGVWVLFLPALLLSVQGVYSLIFDLGGGTSSFILFWMSLLVGGFSLVMLYKVTNNYLTLDDRKDN